MHRTPPCPLVRYLSTQKKHLFNLPLLGLPSVNSPFFVRVKRKRRGKLCRVDTPTSRLQALVLHPNSVPAKDKSRGRRGTNTESNKQEKKSRQRYAAIEKEGQQRESMRRCKASRKKRNGMRKRNVFSVRCVQQQMEKCLYTTTP